MNKLALAAVLVVVPISVEAADLADNYVFIEDSFEPAAPSLVGHLELSAGWWHKDQQGQVDHWPSLMGPGCQYSVRR